MIHQYLCSQDFIIKNKYNQTNVGEEWCRTTLPKTKTLYSGLCIVGHHMRDWPNKLGHCHSNRFASFIKIVLNGTTNGFFYDEQIDD